MTQKRPQKITDTTLRDAQQSLLATRLKTEDMVEVARLLDQVGFHSMEIWGGATYDSCMRYLQEDPWERLRVLRIALSKTKTQMLLRGQNFLGYHHFADDVVEAFIKKSVDYGIDIIRIFDALNDPRNLKKSIEVTRQCGAHAQAALAYTLSPVHDVQYFYSLAKELVELGADSLAIKDMAGLLSPYDAYELILLLQPLGVPLQLHCHYSSGMASMSYIKAIEAGVDVVDTALAPLAMGASQPATESLVAALKGTPYDTELDLELLSQGSDYVKDIRHRYPAPPDVALTVDTHVLTSQIPGGMISNLQRQLRDQQAEPKLNLVLEEVPRVRKDLGYPPLVTPTSQLVGSQAVANILLGERYKLISTEVKNYVRGLYGRPPADLSASLVKKVLQGAEPFTGRPADLLEPQLPAAAKDIAMYSKREEDVLSYALFPQVALELLKKQQQSRSDNELDLVQMDTVDTELVISDEDSTAYPM
ncbi:MAG: pyruvate carboxylase subunit B [Firmicutes bacterium]|nr:pyruvate carboxylase subunit B [Bacillota bacterium]